MATITNDDDKYSESLGSSGSTDNLSLESDSDKSSTKLKVQSAAKVLRKMSLRLRGRRRKPIDEDYEIINEEDYEDYEEDEKVVSEMDFVFIFFSELV